MTAQESQPHEQHFLPTDLPPEIPAHLPHPPHKEEKEQDYGYATIKTLLAWQAPGRPFQRKNREYFLSTLLIALFIEIILFLFSQYLLMLVVVSIVFLSFALATVPPRNFRFKISTEGLMVEDYFYLWQELYDFYFKKIHGEHVLHVRTKAIIPGELVITLGSMEKEHVKAVLLPYLPFREVVRPTFMEKSGDWLSRTFPLERTPKTPRQVASDAPIS